MRVLPKKAASPARRAQIPPKPPAQKHSFPSPTRGWVLNENLAMVGPGSALILDNWLCTTTGIVPRGGSEKTATVSTTGAVTSMFRYISGTTEKLFAATDSSVFDVTSVADVDVVPTADITGQSNGYYARQMFSVTGGDYLYITNEGDEPQIFDGTSWTQVTGVSTPAITGVTTNLLSFVWTYASRLFFIEDGTMRFWYLPVDSIGGAAQSYSLGGVFRLGGKLLFGATWSADAGDGLDDKCLFVTDQGEVAVFSGVDPSSASTWSLEGVYQITSPLGKNATMRAGGDLLIATDVGLVPMSAAIQRDIAALSLAAASSPIEPFWVQSALEHPLPWEIMKWPEKNVMVIAGASNSDDDTLLVCNLETRGWSRFTGIGGRCLGFFNGFVYAGGNDGIVKRLETGGNDMGSPYTCTYLGNHEGMGAPGAQKTIAQARAIFKAGHDIQPLVSAQVDYKEVTSTAPDSISNFSAAVWDGGNWDEVSWDSGLGVASVQSLWRPVGRTGYTIAPEVQMTFSITPNPSVELIATDVTYYVGEAVT